MKDHIKWFQINTTSGTSAIFSIQTRSEYWVRCPCKFTSIYKNISPVLLSIIKKITVLHNLSVTHFKRFYVEDNLKCSVTNTSVGEMKSPFFYKDRYKK